VKTVFLFLDERTIALEKVGKSGKFPNNYRVDIHLVQSKEDGGGGGTVIR
jgi:hypothetical protein